MVQVQYTFVQRAACKLTAQWTMHRVGDSDMSVGLCEDPELNLVLPFSSASYIVQAKRSACSFRDQRTATQSSVPGVFEDKRWRLFFQAGCKPDVCYLVLYDRIQHDMIVLSLARD
jgi:hypothetical protein